MKQFTTQGIILTRTEFGEADRILTFITPDHGIVRAIAKGVRKAGAKLAGAIELFSVTELTVVDGRGELGTIISARLARHYGKIVKDINRTNKAYEFLLIINKVTEARADEAYFTILDASLTALNDINVPYEVADLWFRLQLLKISGHTPNLATDETGKKLVESKTYNFDYDKMRFASSDRGEYGPEKIKFLRLGLAAKKPDTLARVQESQDLAEATLPLVQLMLQAHLRL